MKTLDELVKLVENWGVVLIGLAKLNGLSLKECLEHSYNEIKDRKGKMVNRVFIKEKNF